MGYDAPPVLQGSVQIVEPHRGALVLVLGVLSLTVCAPLGVVAWILGSGDLKRMRRGTMDPEGRGLTMGGMICGIVGTALLVLSVLLVAAWILIVMVLGFGAAAAGH